jgi:hypothetical protein
MVCKMYNVSRLSRTAKITTLSVYVVLAFIVYLLYYSLRNYSILGFDISITMLIILIIVMIPIAYMPRKYLVCSDGLVIRKLLGEHRIPWREVSRVIVKPLNHRKLIRLLGSGGFHGYIGTFKIYGLDKALLYVTDLSKTILFELKRGGYVGISPENPEEILKDLKHILGEDKVIIQ